MGLSKGSEGSKGQTEWSEKFEGQLEGSEGQLEGSEGQLEGSKGQPWGSAGQPVYGRADYLHFLQDFISTRGYCPRAVIISISPSANHFWLTLELLWPAFVPQWLKIQFF